MQASQQGSLELMMERTKNAPTCLNASDQLGRIQFATQGDFPFLRGGGGGYPNV